MENHPPPDNQGEIIKAPPRWRRLLRRFAFGVLFMLMAFTGSILAVITVGRQTVEWHGLQVELRLLPAKRGRTELIFKPLGEIYAPTHVTPVILQASLERIDIEGIQKLVKDKPNPDDLEKDFQAFAQSTLRTFVLHQLAVGSIGALVAPLVLGVRRRLLNYPMAALSGFLLVGLSLGSASMSYNPNAFNDLVYVGAFKQAPSIIQFSKDAFQKVQTLSAKLTLVADNLNVLYGRIAAVQGLEAA